MTSSVPIFDGHNDVLLRLWRHENADPVRAFLDGGRKGQLDLPMAREGGFAGGMFAIFVPSPDRKPRNENNNSDGPGLDTGPLAREAKPLAPVAWSLVVVLLFLSLFWTVSHYAGIRGVDLAIQAEQRIPRQPSVTIYSARRLYLEPPVTETELPDANAAYRYRYTGLKLLFRSEHNYFLRPSNPTDTRNIIITESPELRFEFTPS